MKIIGEPLRFRRNIQLLIIQWVVISGCVWNLFGQGFPDKLGDIDRDGRASILDLVAILNHIQGGSRLSNEMTVFADVNQDGAVNNADIQLVEDAILEIRPLPSLPLARILNTSPSTGATKVSTTRETVIWFSQPLSAETIVTRNDLYAEFGVQRILTRSELAPDRRSISLFYSAPLPGSARIRVTLNGNAITDFIGRAIDADGDGQQGGVAVIEFETLSLTPFPNTIVAGRVFASQLATNSGTTGSFSVNAPLKGAIVTADGLEEKVRAVTDQFGDFRLTNAPAGHFFVHIDGRAVTDLEENIRWPDLNYYPYVGKEWESIPGGETNIGEVFLPLVTQGTLQTVSATMPTVISFPTNVLTAYPELEGVNVTVPPNALFNDNGIRGGKVGIAPVPPDRLPGPLPLGLSFPLVITVQTDGASNFSEPVPVCFPNLTNSITGKPPLPPGAKSALWSFNHDSGEWEIIGPMTVSADGRLICSDPGVGIRSPGWHGASEGSSGGGGEASDEADDDEPPDNENPGSKSDDDDESDPTEPDGCPNPSASDENPSVSDSGGGGDSQSPEDKATDPIKLFSGEFEETVEDLRIPGVGFDFVWSRTYRSIGAADQALPLSTPGEAGAVQGIGWDYSYNLSVRPVGRSIEMANGRGKKYSFSPTVFAGSVASSYQHLGYFRVLIQLPRGSNNPENPPATEPESYRTVLEDGTVWNYHANDGSAKAGKIESIVDRNGNTMRFAYDTMGRLDHVIDTLGRRISMGYNASGFLSTITDFTGRVVRYDYYGPNDAGGSQGDLRSVTAPAVTGTPNGNDFPTGKKTVYTYSKGFADEQLNHNLLTITDGRRNDPNDPTYGQGPYLVNIYSTVTNPADLTYDRVVAQIWGGSPVHLTYLSLAPSPENNGAVTKTIVNDRKGHVKEFFYDAANRLVIVREFTGKAILGQPVTETENRPSNPLRNEAPPFFETRYHHNDDNRITRIIYPNGNIRENVYEADLNPNAPPTRRGNLRIIRRLPGSHLPAGDQAVITDEFDYLENFNFVTRHKDGRGNEMINQYDSKGNLTNRIHRISGITEQFEYNDRGQMRRHVGTDNGSGVRPVRVIHYYESGSQRGFVQRDVHDVDHLALTATFEYNAAGNVTRSIDPRGNDTRFDVNALNQIVRETSSEIKIGTGTRYQRNLYYDANNNLTRIDIENRNEAGALQENAWLTTRLDYEILDRLVRKTQEISATNSIITEYGYDANRNRTLVRFGEATAGRQSANVVTNIFDERDLLYIATSAPGDMAQSSSRFDYDGNQNRLRVWQGIEGEPRVSEFIYDGYDRLVAATDAMGNVARIYYDEGGNAIRSRMEGELLDEPGQVNNVRLSEAFYDYDQMSRMTNHAAAFFDSATQQPLTDGYSTTRTVYTDSSQVFVVINDNGHGMTNRYDSAYRLQERIDAKGNKVRYEHDGNGNIVRVTEAELSDLGTSAEVFTTGFGYDGLNRLIEAVDSSSNTNRIGYDSRSNRTLVIDAKGNITRHDYDGLNRLISSIRQLTETGDGSGRVTGSITTRQVWDDTSRLTAQIDDNGNPTTYRYDPLNRVIATILADGTGRTNRFDTHGNMVSVVDANGSIVTNRFDLLNRLERRDVTAGVGVVASTTFENYRYDGLSRLVYAANDASIVQRGFNSLSQLVVEVQSGYTNMFAHDGVGNLFSSHYPGGRIITTSFDELERKKVISDANGEIARYHFVGPGRVQRREYGNGSRSDFVYDGIVGVPNPADDAGVKQMVRVTHAWRNDNSVIDSHSFIWDGAGNKLARRDVRADGPQVQQVFRYDSVYRLIESARGPPSGLAQITGYSFDGVGNRKAVTGGAASGDYTLIETLPEPADFQVNQYSSTPFDSRTSDANGNLAKATSDQGDRSFGYDYRNRLVAFTNSVTGTIARYVYDVLGRRIEKRVGANITRYLYHGWQEIEERSGNGIVEATYVYGLHVDEVLQMRRSNADYYYHSDDQQNVTSVSSGSSVVERYDYGDYGIATFFEPNGTLRTASQIGNPYLSMGRRFDPETGLLYFRTRYLDPTSGRFIGRDIIGAWADGANLGNGFAFVGNNPWSFGDPWGLSKEDSWWDDFLDSLSEGALDARDWSRENTPWFNDALNAIGDFGREYGDLFPFSSLYNTYNNPNATGLDYAFAIADIVPFGKIARGVEAVYDGVKFLKKAPPVKYIGKQDDLKNIPREHTLLDDLPNLGSYRDNYYQNSSVLRKALRDGYEIRDASIHLPNSAPDPTFFRPDRTVGQSFLGAERNIMDNKGFTPDPTGVYRPK